MPDRLMFDVGFGRAGRPRDHDEPMRLLVLGDFSGRPAAERTPLASRSVLRADVDTLDAVMHRLQPRLPLSIGEVRFERLEDFHPDRLYARLEIFEALRRSRAAPSAGDDVLGRLLGKPAEPAPPAAPAPATGLDALIRNIVEPHVVKEPSARTSLHLGEVDAAMAEHMRTLLHDPAFQSLEAAWRSVQWLISSLELDENLQLHLLDVTRDELMADVVASQGQLGQSGAARVLASGADGARWSALIGLFQFGRSAPDVGLLAALGLIAAGTGAPLLAGADWLPASDAAGGTDDWQALRRSEAAPWIGLAAPRVLLRLPYGRRTDPIESFPFDEFTALPAHDDFLWGSPAVALALLVGRGFTARGWNVQPGDEREIDDLPAYVYVRDGEPNMQACAERFLTDREVDEAIRAGLMPIVSRRDRPGVVVPRVQSIADPPAPLAW